MQLGFNGKTISEGVSMDVLGKVFEMEAQKNSKATLDDITWCGLLEWRGPEGSVRITHADQSETVKEFSGKLGRSASTTKKIVLLHPGDVVHLQTKCGKEMTLTVQANEYKVSEGLVSNAVLDTDIQPQDSAEIQAVKKWLLNERVGVSSKTMSSVLYGIPKDYSDYDGPYDPSDFGRCMKFLECVPQARARISELSTVNGWENIAPAFDELEALYNQEKLNSSGSAPILYDRLRELRGRSPVKRAKP